MDAFSRIRSVGQILSKAEGHVAGEPVDSGQEMAEFSLDDRAYASLYQDLEPAERQIRLLRIRSHPTSEKDPINCELVVRSLNQKTEYQALSYCWGTEAASCTILINGCRFNIRPNLHEYLKLLCEEGRHNWLYIDAICINQRDLHEKGSQVKLMGDVYREATQVVAWLGAESAKVDRPLEMHSNDETWQLFFDMAALSLVPHSLHMPEDRHSDPFLDKSGLTTWLGETFKPPIAALYVLEPILNCPYWSRLWIVQEMLLAQDLTIRYKRLIVPWRVFYSCLEFGIIENMPNMGNAGRTFSFDQSPDILGPFTNALRVYWLLNEKAKKTNQARAGRIMLSDAVLHYAGQNCTMLCDKVYGLYGLVASLGTTQADYSHPNRFLFPTMIQGLMEIRSMAELDGKLGVRIVDSHSYICHLLTVLGEDLHSAGTTLVVKSVCKKFGLRFADTSLWWARHNHVVRQPSILGKAAAKTAYQRGKLWLHGTLIPTMSVKYNTAITDLYDALGRFNTEEADEVEMTDAGVHAVFTGLGQFFDFDCLLGKSGFLVFHNRNHPKARKMAEEHVQLVKQFPISEGAVRLAERGLEVLAEAIAPLYYAEDDQSRGILATYTRYHDELESLIQKVRTEGWDFQGERDARHILESVDCRRLSIAISGANWVPHFHEQFPIKTEDPDRVQAAYCNPLWLDQSIMRQHPDKTENQREALKSLFLRHEHEMDDEYILGFRADMYFFAEEKEQAPPGHTGQKRSTGAKASLWYRKLLSGHEKID